MKLNTKSTLIAVPLAMVVYCLIIVIGFHFIGDEWEMVGMNVISFFTGVVCFFQVKTYLKNKQSKGEKK